MIENSKFVRVDPETGVVLTEADVEQLKIPGKPTVEPVVESRTNNSANEVVAAPNSSKKESLRTMLAPDGIVLTNADLDNASLDELSERKGTGQ